MSGLRVRNLLTRPEFWAGLGSLLLLLPFLAFPFKFDQSVFGTVADAMLHGGVAYREAWEHKPPGVLMCYYTSFVLFGRQVWSPRLLEVIALVTAGTALVPWARRSFGAPWSGVAGALMLALFYYPMGTNTAQPETFQLPFAAWALALWPRRGEAEVTPRRMACLGALLSCTLLFKITLILLPGLLLLEYAESEWRRPGGWRRILALLAGLSAAPLLTAFYYAMRGALPGLLDAWLYFPARYASINAARREWGPHLLRYVEWAHTLLSVPDLLLFGVGIWRGFVLNSPEARRFLYMFAGPWLGAVIQGRFWIYHYIPMLPFLAMAMGLALPIPAGGTGAEGRVRRWMSAAAVFLLAGTLVNLRESMAECWGNFFTRPEFRKEAMLTGSAEQQEIAVALKSLTRPTDRVFVWGEEPTLIWLMERPICPPYFHMIQYAPPWPAPERFDREMASIRAEPPAAIVVCASRTWWRPEPFADLLLQYPDLIAFLEARYARERRVGYYNVWLRKS